MFFRFYLVIFMECLSYSIYNLSAAFLITSSVITQSPVLSFLILKFSKHYSTEQSIKIQTYLTLCTHEIFRYTFLCERSGRSSSIIIVLNFINFSTACQTNCRDCFQIQLLNNAFLVDRLFYEILCSYVRRCCGERFSSCFIDYGLLVNFN